jgi:hypothetical protein
MSPLGVRRPPANGAAYDPKRTSIRAIYHAEEFVDAVGLMSVSASFVDRYRAAAGYVDRILRGAKPQDLPVEQPTMMITVVNLKAARALGLTPQQLLLRESSTTAPGMISVSTTSEGKTARQRQASSALGLGRRESRWILNCAARASLTLFTSSWRRAENEKPRRSALAAPMPLGTLVALSRTWHERRDGNEAS